MKIIHDKYGDCYQFDHFSASDKIEKKEIQQYLVQLSGFVLKDLKMNHRQMMDDEIYLSIDEKNICLETNDERIAKAIEKFKGYLNEEDWIIFQKYKKNQESDGLSLLQSIEFFKQKKQNCQEYELINGVVFNTTSNTTTKKNNKKL